MSTMPRPRLALADVIDAYLIERILAASDFPGPDHVPVPPPPLGQVKKMPTLLPDVDDEKETP